LVKYMDRKSYSNSTYQRTQTMGKKHKTRKRRHFPYKITIKILSARNEREHPKQHKTMKA